MAQQYLPDSLQGRVFYEPGALGYESALQARVQQHREATLAALSERGDVLGGHFAGGVPGDAPPPGDTPEWQVRGHSTVGEHLALVRDRLFALAEVERTHLVLDANAGSGLLTWEACRRATEGGVWARVQTAAEAATLADGSRLLPALAAPAVVTGALADLPRLLEAQAGALPAFDRVLARDVLGRSADKAGRMAGLAALVAAGGRLVLAERVPGEGERLLAGLDWRGVAPDVAERAIAAEEAVYALPDDPLVNWRSSDLPGWAEAAGLTVRHTEQVRRPVEFAIGAALLGRWFGTDGAAPGPLAQRLGDTAEVVRAHLERVAAAGSLRRVTVVALVAAERR